MVLLLLLVLQATRSFSVELYGQGGEDVKALFDAWSLTYRAARDDITLVYDVASAEDALAAIHAGQNDFINLDSAVNESDPDSIEQYGSLFQVPIAAQGLVFTYNLAATVDPASDPRVVLDLKALADVLPPPSPSCLFFARDASGIILLSCCHAATTFFTFYRFRILCINC
jgi:hypothetical protein